MLVSKAASTVFVVCGTRIVVLGSKSEFGLVVRTGAGMGSVYSPSISSSSDVKNMEYWALIFFNSSKTSCDQFLAHGFHS